MTPESRQPSVGGLVHHTLGRVPDAMAPAGPRLVTLGRSLLGLPVCRIG